MNTFFHVILCLSRFLLSYFGSGLTFLHFLFDHLETEPAASEQKCFIKSCIAVHLLVSYSRVWEY